MDNRATTPYPLGKDWKFVPINKVPSSYILKTYKNFKNSHPQLFLFVVENLEILRYLGDKPLDDKESSRPCFKIAYCDEKTARSALSKIRDTDQDHKKPIRVYECEYCSQWHLTSMPIETFKQKK